MEPQPANPAPTPENWPLNYFNYFTEIEEHFQRARGTALFLLSPLDWALIETWKDAGVPLEAALRGIDVAFEKWREKKTKIRQVNSLAYCAQAVMEEAQRMETGLPAAPANAPTEAPFTLDELRSHLDEGAQRITLPELAEVRAEVCRLRDDAAHQFTQLESLEQELAALEDRMIAVARSRQPAASLLEARRELDSQLRLYRGKMTAPQLAMLEKQYLDRRVLEDSDLPRLSLFYLR